MAGFLPHIIIYIIINMGYGALMLNLTSDVTPTLAGPSPFGEADCSGNPYDLRPALHAVMDAESWILDRLPKGQKLVILIAEGDHSFYCHPAFQEMILAAHLAQRKTHPERSFAFGYEVEHNYGQNDGTENDPVSSYIDKQREDRYLVTELFRFCQQNGIPVKFNDIANYHESGNSFLDMKVVVDQRDPFSAAIVKKYMPDMAGKHIVRDAMRYVARQGVTLSNHAIVENALAHMERTESNIYIQQCGSAHVLGVSSLNLAFENSLYARFQEQGVAVLPVIIDQGMEDFVLAKGMSIKGVSTSTMAHELSPQDMKKYSPDSYDDIKAQKIYRQLVAKHSGVTLECV